MDFEVMNLNNDSLFLNLINDLPALVSKMNLNTGKYEFVNKMYEMTTGYNVESLNISSAESLLKLIHRDDINKISETVNNWISSGASEFLRLEYRGYNISGELRWYDSHIYSGNNFTGNNKYLIQVDLDITDKKLQELEVKRSELMLNSLVNNVKHSLWSVDRDYRLVKYNKVFEEEALKLFDITVKPGMLVVESIREEKKLFKELWYSMYKRAMKGESFTEEKQYDFHGDTRYIVVSMNPVMNGNEIIGITAFSYDVTNMKKNREMLLESEVRYQIIIDNLNEGILITDKDDRLIFCNKACENIFGINRDEMIGLDLKKFHDEKNKAVINKQNKLREKGSASSYELEVIRADNTRKTIFVSASPRYDKNSVFMGSYVVALDIDDKKKSEMLIYESEEKLRAITENINCLLWIYDENTDKVVYVNNYYNSLFGEDAEELYKDPQSWLKYLYPGDIDYYNENRDKRTSEGLTYRIIKNGGEIRWLNSRVFPLNPGIGNHRRIVGIAEDITAIKEKEKQLENAKLNAELANRAKSDFLANMSHEIRTPLNGISGFTQMMLDTEISDTQKEYLELIKESSNKLLRVINDILDFSKIAAGRLKFDNVNFSVKDAVKKCITTVELAAREKHLIINSVISDSIPPYVVGDSERLQQVLLNLLSNAVKFSENSDILISVNNIKQAGDKIKLEFKIKDNGIGISEETAKTLFKPFSQGDSSFSRKFGGTGLGLAICKNLVEMMNGEIGLNSNLNIGSEFYFTAEFLLQKAQINSSNDSSMDIKKPVNIHEDNTYNILVVEDEVINQKLVRKILEKYGHSVTVCGNGSEAIEHLAKNKCDIVLMDIQMPVMNGIEATVRIRKSEKRSGRHLPIIAMTANAFMSDREKCFDVGMDEFISKPININEMMFKIHSKVEASQKQL